MTTLVEARLGLDGVIDTKVELRQNWTEDNLQQVFRAAYSQVFGRQGVYASSEFSSVEALLRNGSINVRQFVRRLAKSEFYKDCFFYGNSQVRCIELNFKHLLGRAPYEQSEIAYHLDLYNSEGFDAEIDSYIDSAEYDEAFGDWVVPYYRGFKSQLGMKTVGYTRMFELYRGPGSSDNSQLGGRNSRLQVKVPRNLANSIRTPSSPRGDTGVTYEGDRSLRGTALEEGRTYRVEVLFGGNAIGPVVRRSKQTFTVPYNRFSSLYKEIHRRRGKITNIQPV